MTIPEFQTLLQQQGQLLYRDMPWRSDTRPYYILVSELMLQQTQVDRVKPKFAAFIEHFPHPEALASAPLAEVLRLWQGLGYNRRAKFLHQAAQMVTNDWGGEFRNSADELVQLPGVGVNTAGAISVYAFNQPVVFIETNIRTVLMYHFFDPLSQVSDAELKPILTEALVGQDPQHFYWAMMDYGSNLKKQGVKNVGQSKHYVKQSKLDGSVRQIRGQILKALQNESLTPLQLEQSVDLDERFDPALSSLLKEGMVTYQGDKFSLGS